MTRARNSLASSLASLAGILLAGCASSGTEPHAMTAGQHEAAARNEEQSAKEHSALNDSSQYVAPTITCPFNGGVTCYRSWTSVQNPTEVHLAEGKRHAELAAKHRAASRALRDAEARACKNVPEGDRDVSPFYHREDIISAEPQFSFGALRTIGAEVVFAALPGMTAEWLQSVVDCHLARNAVLGDAAKEMPYCPLAVPHVKATVRSAGNGFAVDISSDDEKSVREVSARVERLTGKAFPKAAQ